MSSNSIIRIVTRKSPLAMLQTQLALDHLKAQRPDTVFEVAPMTTEGDERLQWSLEAKGGKGLFTSALEQAILARTADLAVHSAKDLPTEMDEGLCVAGYLPREHAGDVLIIRDGVLEPKLIATSSPRRRHQVQRMYPQADWAEIRGNVGTRLEKIVQGQADATIMAMAGLRRLGLMNYPGLVFTPLSTLECVPAAGQGAIALQCRTAHQPLLAPLLCAATAFAVTIERAALQAMGGGCHNSSAAHYIDGHLLLYTEKCGFVDVDLSDINDAGEALTSKVQQRIQGVL